MSVENNRYAPPTAKVADPAPESIGDTDAVLIPNGRTAPAGDGAKWIGAAFRLFFQRPWKWLGLFLLWLIGFGILSLIPLVSLVSSLLWPVLGAGLVYAADVLRRTGDFSLRDAFYGFGAPLGKLMPLAGVMLLASFVTVAILAALLGTDAALAIYGYGEPDPMLAISKEFWLAILLSMAVTLPITVATYFAPALIVLHDLSAVDALKMSFFGAIKNILAGLVYGVLLLLVIIVSAIPLGLGLLITMPVAGISLYTMYRGIFVASN